MPQRTLVGVVEVARVRNAEHRAVEPAHVRRRLVTEPQEAELQAVDRVVQVIVAEQLELLDTDRGQQHQRANAPGSAVVQAQRDAAAHAESDDVHGTHVQLLEELQDVSGVRPRRVVRAARRRPPESR